MEGDDSVQDLQFDSGTSAKLRSRNSSSQKLAKPRAKKMEGEEKKSESKKRLKTMESGFDSDDDEPIGSLFRLKKPRNPKKVKGTLEREKGQKTEDREDKLIVEDGDLGGMEDTLASFRKKLKGPKKDTGSGNLKGRGSALTGPLDDDVVLDVKLAPKNVEKVWDICQEGSAVSVDKGVETRCKERVKRPKIDSKMTTTGDHVLCVDDSKVMGSRCDSLEEQKGEELLPGEGSNHSSDEKVDDSLSAFVQRTQSGSIRNTQTNSGLKQNSNDHGLGDESIPISEGGSKSVRRSHSVSASKVTRKNPKFDDSSYVVSDFRTLELDSERCWTVESTLETCQSNAQEELTTDPCSSNKCDGDGKSHACLLVGDASALDQKSKSKTQPSNGGLKFCSMDKASTLIIDDVEMPDPASSPKPMEEFREFEGESDRGFTDPLDLQSNSISAMNISSTDPEISSSSIGKEVPLPSGDDGLDKSCKCTPNEIRILASEKILQATSKVLSQNSSEAAKSESGFHFDQCPTGSQGIPPALSNPSSNFLELAKTSSYCDIPNTEEPGCAADYSKKENALVSDGKLSPKTEISCGLQESGFNFRKCSSISNHYQSSDASKRTFVSGHASLSTNEEANGDSPSSVAPDKNGSFTEDAMSMPDSENRDTKLSAVQRAVRIAKKRRHGDMAYEGDADWEGLINEQAFLENHQVVDYDRSLRSRNKFDSSSTAVTEAETDGAAAVSAGLKARAPGPIEKIKFKEILKRRGGLQEYLECRLVVFET